MYHEGTCFRHVSLAVCCGDHDLSTFIDNGASWEMISSSPRFPLTERQCDSIESLAKGITMGG